MGHGVAQMFAQAGLSVVLFNRTRASSSRAMENIRKGLDLFVAADFLPPAAAEAALKRVEPTTDFSAAVLASDFIVEAVADELPLKQKLFKEMDALAPPHIILASETSGLHITDIARDTVHPERCITAHNYTPPPLMPVVEVVPGEKTSAETVQLTCALLRRIGKDTVICKEVSGHIGSRFTNALRREAFHLIEQGLATPEAIDTVMRSVGRLFPVMGILLLTDFSGVDMARNSQRNILPRLSHDSKPSALIEKMTEAGKLGIKSGEGFYQWNPERIQEIVEARGRELIRWMRAAPLPPLPPRAGFQTSSTTRNER
ncbi:MAG: 3-hydroxyacyl-CoA dehydrogenase family protein [Candidatus Tectomicrobia bacterium]|uniref:3-hydroxyacyl-CoA dehydrogenase family protein n=1 Tax=Tectimicrobiota bacterium TaxID=2528274 RepID=A0A932MMX0_UNCTE|nr:3-hydroxyacyl-CoA dehydrogenase family protein [Candidatus Tectomicrobia bacterium]